MPRYFFGVKKSIHFLSLVSFMFGIWHDTHAVVIGSDTIPSREANAHFPSADTNNEMRGFAAIVNGFTLEDVTTTCTFDDFLPVSGPIILGGGRLSLSRDLALENISDVHTTGTIHGNFKAFKLPSGPGTIKLPSAGSCGQYATRFVDQDTLLVGITSVDWLANGSYFAAGTLVSLLSGELNIYSFNGSTMTLTDSEEITDLVHSVRFHPTLNYIAIGTELPVLGGSVRTFSLDTGTGTVTPISNIGLGLLNNGFCVEWHPSGTYLVAGTNVAGGEIIVYTFDTGTGVIAASSSANLTPDRAVSEDSMSFSPGGNFLAVGVANNGGGGVNELLIYPFDGTLGVPGGADLGSTVNGLDWNPTGTYIAVGLAGSPVGGILQGPDTIRIFEHNSGANTVTEVTSILSGEDRPVGSVHWDKTGAYLLVAYASVTTSDIRIYCFDKINKTLTLVHQSDGVLDSVNAARFSRDGNYTLRGDLLFNVQVDRIEKPPFFVKDTTLELNTDTQLHAPMEIQGTCNIIGNGHHLTFQDSGAVIVRPSGHLECENVALSGIGSSNLRCMTDSGSIILQDCGLSLARDYTFSRGALFFEGATVITGTSKFVYESGITSSIASLGTLMIDRNITFSYAPRLGKRDLIYMTDESSNLYLNGCTLHTTRTGLSLTQGNLLLENLVTFSSEARYAAEALQLGSSLNINMLGSAVLELFGKIQYN